MRLLAFDTALDACSAAIWQDGRVTHHAYEARARGHAEALMPMIERLRAAAGLDYEAFDRFAVTVGPGTFTGLRIGLAAARGLALAADRPLVGVTTLEAVARAGAAELGHMGETARGGRAAGAWSILAALDARRGEIYVQPFALSGQALGTAEAVRPSELDRVLNNVQAGPGPQAVFVAGTGIPRLREWAKGRGAGVRFAAEIRGSDARDVAAIAAGRPLEERPAPPAPVYLRAPGARLPGSAAGGGAP